MELPKRLSGAAQIYHEVNKRVDGELFTTKQIRAALPNIRASQFAGGLNVLVNCGGIEHTSTQGKYIVRKLKLTNYGRNKKWQCVRAKDRVETVEPEVIPVSDKDITDILGTDMTSGVIKHASVKAVTLSDAEILDNLLTALADAEPVIRKYKELNEVIAKLQK